MFLENDSYLGQHLGFMKKHQRDCWGLSVQHSTHTSELELS